MDTKVVATGAANQVNHVDVLIVGAGISGVGAAYHLQDQCPGKSYLILEAKDSFGGTWEKLGQSGDYISLAADVNKSADELRQGLENWGATVDGIREE